jgi:hypothetical protein
MPFETSSNSDNDKLDDNIKQFMSAACLFQEIEIDTRNIPQLGKFHGAH